MKFKAKLSPSQTSLLYNLIHPISRLSSPSTILYLDDDKLVLSTRGGGSSSTTSSSSNPNKHNNTNSILNPTSTYTQSALHSNNDAEGIFCFAELITKNGIFNSLIIQSIEQDNAILMEMNIGQLKTALRGVLNAQLKFIKDYHGGSGTNIGGGNNASMLGFGVAGPELVIKLAKRNGGLPHLCLDVKEKKFYPSDTIIQHQNNSSSLNMIGVHHAIPVRLMKVQELQYHVPPRLGMPDVQLELPNDRPLKNVVDRLKSISPHVFIEGSMKGLLSLRIDGDGASIRTTYTNLNPIHEDCKSQTTNNDHTTTPQDISQSQQNLSSQYTNCTVKVDSKKLYASLHWQGTLNIARDVSTAVLCLWENEMLVLDVTLNPDVGRFMYYIPVHYLSSDWD